MAIRKLTRREVGGFLAGFALAIGLAIAFYGLPPIQVDMNIDAAKARDLISKYRTSSPSPNIYGFSIPATVIKSLSMSLGSSSTTDGFQVYYGLSADGRDTSFVCVPLDNRGLEMKPPVTGPSTYIPNYKVVKFWNHLYSRPCPYACDRTSSVCANCGGTE